ncbi:MAG: hypothetical protein ACNFW9_04765 [Candidatus Kerfeldbacteria bacterium]
MAKRGVEGGGISFNYDGPSGKLVENNMLGGVKKTQEQQSSGETSYQKFDDALDYVKENQIGDPTDPHAWFAYDLHATIADELGLEDYSQLKYYTAVGSSLDQYHSIDCFFEFQVDPENNPKDIVRVTIDLTTNPNKMDYRADMVILVPHDGLDPKDDDYKKVLNDHALEIAVKFKPYINKKEVSVA